MTMQVTIRTNDTDLVLDAPYDPALPTKAKAIGGRWSTTDRVWHFDLRDQVRVEALATELYGWSPEDADVATVTVRVPVPRSYHTDEFRVGGRRLAWRPARDSAVRLTDGVVVVEGRFPGRGGSMRNPVLNPDDAAVVLEVRDVARSVAARIVAEAPGATIVTAEALDREALIAERSVLAERMAAIDRLLEPRRREPCDLSEGREL